MRLRRRSGDSALPSLETRLEAFDRRRTSPEHFVQGLVLQGPARDALDALDDLELARGTRSTPDVVQAWRDGTNPDAAAFQRLDALGRILARLQRVGLEDPDARREWLRSDNRAFGGEAALDLVGRDEDRRVLAYVERLS